MISWGQELTLPEDIREFAWSVIGEFHLVAEYSWPHGESRVLRIQDVSGNDWVVKTPVRKLLFEQELHAYENWVPVLGDSAPRLIGRDHASLTLLLSHEPGRVEPPPHPDVHRQAGALIRRLHDSQPPIESVDFAAKLAARLESGLRHPACRSLPAREIAFARHCVLMGEEPSAPMLMPTHQDNQPRNWLLDTSGRLRLIDFGLSRLDAWVRDLLRLHFWFWDDGLRQAFFDGYGRTLSDEDEVLFEAMSAVMAVMTVVWGSEHRDQDFAGMGRSVLRRLEEAGRTL